MPAACARASACACGLSDATATISMPSRPWTLSISACRLVPAPDARTAILKGSGIARDSDRATAGHERQLGALERVLAGRRFAAGQRVGTGEAGVAVRVRLTAH